MDLKILYFVILASGFVFGKILFNTCKDEVDKWKNKLIIMTITSFITALIISMTKNEYKLPIITTLYFISITNLTIIWKTDKNNKKAKQMKIKKTKKKTTKN